MAAVLPITDAAATEQDRRSDMAADVQFSIHQDLWHDAWVAATSAVRTRRKQVDFSVQRRVQRLLADYGPESGRPLTLRVYGTMVKGFCVINNDRARALHGDCERLVLLFAERPFADDSKDLRLPAAKKQRVDALTLDLDLRKVQESETFDWSQAPLEGAAVAHLEDYFAPNAAAGGANAPSTAAPASLLEQAPLLDEAFPAIETPAPALDAGAVVAEGAAPGELLALPAPPVAVGEEAHLQQHSDVVELPHAKRRRFLRGIIRPPIPGYVFGFDEQPAFSHEELDEWQREATAISGRCCGIEDYAVLLIGEARPDHFGPLRRIPDPPDAAYAISAAMAAAGEFGEGQAAPSGGVWPSQPVDAQAAAVQDKAAHGGTTQPQVLLPLASKDATAPDPFRPYAPENPILSSQEVGAALTALLSGGQATSSSEVGAGAAEAGDSAMVEATYDAQTARVGAVFRGFMHHGCEERAVTLDDFIPMSTTDRATAARTFHALLTLATAGDFSVAQSMPYGPISVSEA